VRIEKVVTVSPEFWEDFAEVARKIAVQDLIQYAERYGVRLDPSQIAVRVERDSFPRFEYESRWARFKRRIMRRPRQLLAPNIVLRAWSPID
jgi:hypothetical protein